MSTPEPAPPAPRAADAARPAAPEAPPLPRRGRRPGPTAPCFACGSRWGVPVGWTWWGPGALLGEVQCVDCPARYAARSGRSNAWRGLALLTGELALALGALVVAG